MAKKPLGIDLKHLARLGAVARLAELEQEMTALRRAFPGLRTQKPAVAADAGDEPGAKAPAKKRRRRSKMSAEQRKAVSERMSKFWAARRAKTGKK
jgi:hypothetical protein